MTKYNKTKEPRPIRLVLASMAVAAGIAVAPLPGPAHAAEFTVYKSPWCGCCSKWVEHLQAEGQAVTTKNVESLDLIKNTAGVPERFQACHTAVVDGYVVEGHVPAKDIDRLLAERPKAKGLAVPGMPVGSPGMDGGAPERYDVMLFEADGTASVYAKY